MTMTTSKQSGKSRNALPKSTHRKTVRSAARKPASLQMKLPGAAPSTPIATNNKQRSDTKQARVIAMLRAPAGATIDAMMRATGWQQHSVRGFLAGIVRKKLGLDLISGVGENGRVYRINDRTASSAANTKTNRAA
jgi:hypothetical protein